MKLETKAMQIEIKRYETLVFGKVTKINEKLLEKGLPETVYKNSISDFRIILQKSPETYFIGWSLNVGITNKGVSENVFSYNFKTEEKAENVYKSILAAVLELEEIYDF